MPYKFEKDKKKLPRDKDRRHKLTEEQKDEIRANEKCLSQRVLASKYHVSRRAIQFILDPEKLKENRKRRLERGGWKQYYNKNKHAKTVKEHRRYKKEVLEKLKTREDSNE